MSEPARHTAEIVGETLGIKVKKLSKMQNLNHGLWQGMLVDDVQHKQPKVYRQWLEQPENVCPPEGEMLGEAEERVRAAMTKLLKKHKEGFDRRLRARAAVEPRPPFHHPRRTRRPLEARQRARPGGNSHGFGGSGAGAITKGHMAGYFAKSSDA